MIITAVSLFIQIRVSTYRSLRCETSEIKITGSYLMEVPVLFPYVAHFLFYGFHDYFTCLPLNYFNANLLLTCTLHEKLIVRILLNFFVHNI
jgi:hypothetical protein